MPLSRDEMEKRVAEILAKPGEREAQDQALREFGGFGVHHTNSGPEFTVDLETVEKKDDKDDRSRFREIGRGSAPSEALRTAREEPD